MGPGDILDGRFRLEARVGAGGMGEVFRAIDGMSGERVAIKVLLDGEGADHARFAREAEVLAGLSHPGIVRYVARGLTAAGAPYLAMEWLEGEDVGARLRRGRLGVREAISFAARVADALAAVHARGVVHRDLKPTNVLLVGGDAALPKLLDFGIARLSAAARLTRTQTVRESAAGGHQSRGATPASSGLERGGERERGLQGGGETGRRERDRVCVIEREVHREGPRRSTHAEAIGVEPGASNT